MFCKWKPKNCTACNTKRDKDNCKKGGTVCKHCYNGEKRNKNIIVPQKRNNDNNASFSAHENHRHVSIGPSNIGEIFHKLKILEERAKIYLFI